MTQKPTISDHITNFSKLCFSSPQLNGKSYLYGMKSFASDNYAGVLPEVMQALHKSNENHAISYGHDPLTQRVQQLFREQFDKDAETLFVFNGTGANVLSISSATHSFHSVLCADLSHIYCDESSAPETFTGCRFFPIPIDADGKLTIAEIEKKLIRKGDVHFAQPGLISVTQATEYGTVYSPEHLKAIGALAHRHGLYFHIDGSRFFNAAASLGCSLKALSADVGVDVLSLGGTKLGMMFGEAVIVFNKMLAASIGYKQKQAMQLASKTRFIAAQFEAVLQDDFWRQPASQANRMARELAAVLQKHPEITVTKPVDANAVFALMPASWIPELQKHFPFYVWNEMTNEVRLMCAFDTTEGDIYAFADLLDRLGNASI